MPGFARHFRLDRWEQPNRSFPLTEALGLVISAVDWLQPLLAKKEDPMISRLWKRIPILAVALGSGLILAGARGGVAQRHDQAAEAQPLEGTWRVRVQVIDCQTGEPLGDPFRALETFARGGTMTETSGTIVFPNVRSPGHGVWSADANRDGSERSYRAASTAFITRDGVLVLTQTITQNIQIGDNPDEFVSNVSAEFFNPDGELVSAGCGTAAGERFQ